MLTLYLAVRGYVILPRQYFRHLLSAVQNLISAENIFALKEKSLQLGLAAGFGLKNKYEYYHVSETEDFFSIAEDLRT